MEAIVVTEISEDFDYLLHIPFVPQPCHGFAIPCNGCKYQGKDSDGVPLCEKEGIRDTPKLIKLPSGLEFCQSLTPLIDSRAF